jgi:valyl-tRNA synthetase
LHPFTPYVTEELWQHLRTAVMDSPYKDRLGKWDQALMISSWPDPREPESWEEERIKEFELLQDITKTIRNLRAEKNIKPGKLIPANLVSKKYAPLLEKELQSLASIAQLDPEEVHIFNNLEKIDQGQIALVAGPIEIYLPLSGLVDLKEERLRITNELKDTTSQIQRLESLLDSPFAQKAPDNIVAKEEEKLAAYQETRKKLEEQLHNLPSD